MMHIANVVCCQFPVVAAAILFMHEHECDCNGNCSKKKAPKKWVGGKCWWLVGGGGKIKKVDRWSKNVAQGSSVN